MTFVTAPARLAWQHPQMRLTRRICLSALIWVMCSLSAGTGTAAAGVRTLAERIELLGWSDPERAARLIDAAATPAERPRLDVAMLEVSGIVYADMRRDADVAVTVAALKAAAGRGDGFAAVALQTVRAHQAYQEGRYADAAAALAHVDPRSVRASAEQYRLALLRGEILRAQRRADAAVTALQGALGIARAQGDDPRSAHALLALAAAYTAAGQPDRAAAQLTFAQTLAVALDDETVQTALDEALADVARSRMDPSAERRLRLSALEHAKLARSEAWLAIALARLADFHLQSREFRDSLNYSQSAAPWVTRAGSRADEWRVCFDEGLALIALGRGKAGQEKVERSIADTMARANLADARDMLREYAALLERSGYLMMAIQAYQRLGAIDDQMLAVDRGGVAAASAVGNGAAMRNGGAAPADEAPAVASTTAPGLRRPVLFTLLIGTAGICAAFAWAFVRIKHADSRARSGVARDPLTGLWNRRYFNEQILPDEAAQPANGCVLLADFDRLKRINDDRGHAAGDRVLRAVSERLAAAVRDCDTLVRWEGDVFLCLLDAVTAEQANRTAERLLDAVRSEPVMWHDEAIDCTISIGYACFPLAGAAAGIPLVAAIDLVGRALAEAKQRGRDRACLISALSGHATAATDPGQDDATAALVPAIELTDMGVAA